MLEELGGRKFIFALIALFMAFGLVLAKVVEVPTFFDFVKFIGVTYIAGNSIAKFASR